LKLKQVTPPSKINLPVQDLKKRKKRKTNLPSRRIPKSKKETVPTKKKEERTLINVLETENKPLFLN
jgi:hypothetical protein